MPAQLKGVAVWRDGKISGVRDAKVNSRLQELIDNDVYLKSLVDDLVMIGAYGIAGTVDTYDDLPSPVGTEDKTIYIVQTDTAEPNGLYWVISEAWVYLSSLAIDDAGEVTFDPTASGMTATDVQAAIDEVEGRVDSNDGHRTTTSGNPHGVTAAEAGAEEDGAVATHAAIATAHQDAPGLIATHAGDVDAHHDNSDDHAHANSAQLDLVTDGDHDAISSGNPHGVTAAEAGAEADGNVATHAAIATAHQDAPGLIATHTADADAHQDAPGLIATHAADADAHQDAPGLIAGHAAVATAHQDAPGLIASHAGDVDAHHDNASDPTSDEKAAMTNASTAPTGANPFLTVADDAGGAFDDASDPIVQNTDTKSIVHGNGSAAAGVKAHAEGNLTHASGISSHAEGNTSWADGDYSHAEGSNTFASGDSSHAEGHLTLTGTYGYYSHAEGYQTKADAQYAHAEGEGTFASGTGSHAEGKGSVTTVAAPYSHAEGLNSVANAVYAHAEGGLCEATGSHSHAEGYQTKAAVSFAHAEGESTFAGGAASHAEGSHTTTGNGYAHAEGSHTLASGYGSHAEGQGSVAYSDYSHAEGIGAKTTIRGSKAHATGMDTVVGDRQKIELQLRGATTDAGAADAVHGAGTWEMSGIDVPANTSMAVKLIACGADATGTQSVSYERLFNIKYNNGGGLTITAGTAETLDNGSSFVGDIALAQVDANTFKATITPTGVTGTLEWSIALIGSMLIA